MSEKPGREARTFFVDTRFQRLARRPGGVPRDQAIENAQAKIDAGQPEFEAWLDGQLHELVDIVRQVQAGTADPAWSAAIASHCRQLRDVGTTMGFVLLTFVANNLCEMLESANGNGAQCNLELIACHVDALLLARQKQYRKLRPEQLPELSAGLRRVAEFAESTSIAPDDAGTPSGQ
jgi:hypothetical protein